MRNIIFVIVFALLLIKTAKAEEPNKLTLSDAIKHTIDNSEEIKISKERERVSFYEGATVVASLIPNFRTQIHENPVKYTLWQEDDEQNDLYLARENQIGMGLYWNLTEIPTRLLTLKKFQIKSQRDKHKTSLETKNRIVNTVNKYYELIYQMTKYDVIKNRFETSNKELKNQEILYTNGRLTKGDYLQSQVEHNNISSELFDQENSVNNAKIDLNVAMGNDKQQDLDVEMNIEIDRDLKYEDVIEGFEEKDIEKKYSKKNLDMIRTDSIISTASILPKVNVGANYIISRYDSSNKMRRTPGHIELVIAAEINFFDMIKNYNNKKIHDLNYKISRMNESLRQSNAKKNISSLFFNYEQELKKYKLEEKNLLIAKENLEIAKSRYDSGIITLNTYQKALLNERQTHLRLISSAHKVKKIEVQLKAYAGQIEELMK